MSGIIGLAFIFGIMKTKIYVLPHDHFLKQLNQLFEKRTPLNEALDSKW